MKMNFKIVTLLVVGLTGVATSDATELLEPTVLIVLLIRYAHSMSFVRWLFIFLVTIFTSREVAWPRKGVGKKG